MQRLAGALCTGLEVCAECKLFKKRGYIVAEKSMEHLH